MSEKKVNGQPSFKDTLNLPHTDFPMQAKAAVEDPAMIKRWIEEDLFSTSFHAHEGKEKYILHDGPPYANGNIHLGHAYNKILKDIIAKSRRMQGKHVPITPGWDCHGLPIEYRVSKDNPGLDPLELKKACRAFANHWIEIQKEEFKALGVLMDWSHPYLTMDYTYEANILRAFAQFVADGYIERKKKTVHWCATCQTVLAAAEIEFQERKDPSIYVAFPLEQRITDELWPALQGKPVNLLIWTTTPWTLPLNRAVLLRPKTEYVVLAINDGYYIVGKELADAVVKTLGVEKNIVQEFMSDDLFERRAQLLHPFIDGLRVPVLLEPSVEVGEGTACVHCAPGCGPEDYETGVRNNLEIYSPLSVDGKYTNEIQPIELEGMSITDGQGWVIKQLTERGLLLYKGSIRHSYPHCWRCHQGLMFRATKQWFCNLSRGNLKQRVLEAIDGIQALPESSINRLRAMVEGRLEWCLSRQRVWGSPIVALLCKKCDYTYIAPGLIEKVADGVATQGIEYWDMVTAQELLPIGFVCPLCKSTDFKKETDILDVWFDSGVSHYAVLKQDPQLAFPADIYVEGSDQHRGWFQSSLLTAMVIEAQAPMRMILTHGFTVDDRGRKMSKSVGNVVAPAEIIKQLGTDGLRLWVASIDYAGDAVISGVLLDNVKEVFRKVRNTCRFLLSNLNDFSIETDAVAFDDMLPLDRYALAMVHELNKDVQQSYEKIALTAIFHKLADFCTVELSSLYLDMVKDRLYVEKKDGLERRSAQTACWHILDTITKLSAPILSFTAESVSDHYQKNKKQSIHLQEFVDKAVLDNWLKGKETMFTDWQLIKNLRDAVLKEIERLREQGLIKHSLEARVTLFLDEPVVEAMGAIIASLHAVNQDLASFLKEMLIVSQVEVALSSKGLNQTSYTGLYCLAEKALGDKCPRCWQWDQTAHVDRLCGRCQRVLGA